MSDKWKQSKIILLLKTYKDNDKEGPHQPILLISVFKKLIHSMIENRLELKEENLKLFHLSNMVLGKIMDALITV